ncbi:MAG TPA: hypothetical protein DCS13_05490 [Candidatus Margulisbacteria bacterium]|nr:MAG: hypothetical protein A2X43_10485 [Candidatus Margulisbacteria bacterium GWD2_39_127]HAR62901.1 hypothetical protein [Candidatus Margulisiibacteriota bacterium]
MTSNIESIINQGESETVEFKTSFNSSVIETIVAFANNKGGYVFVGISDNGKIIGVDTNENIHRNRLLAESFYLSGEIEKYGTGITRVRRMLLEEGYSLSLGYEVRPNTIITKLALIVSNATPNATPMTTPISNKNKIIKLIKDNPRITRDELASEIGISINGIKQHISKLKKENFIKRIGSNRAGYWKITQ